ncbi:MAG: hypothetical protein KAI28_12500, partial [Sphingomonadales bacterium]|nr:hypothetical protein [Sphingomonadales bacterium]
LLVSGFEGYRAVFDLLNNLGVDLRFDMFVWAQFIPTCFASNNVINWPLFCKAHVVRTAFGAEQLRFHFYFNVHIVSSLMTQGNIAQRKTPQARPTGFSIFSISFEA